MGKVEIEIIQEKLLSLIHTILSSWNLRTLIMKNI